MIRSTTILCVRHNGQVAMAGDGQVSFNTTVMKHSARKIRKVHHDQVLTGFAGAAADAFTLVDRFEAKLGGIPGQPDPCGRGACQGLARRPRFAAPGGDACRGGPGDFVDSVRYRRYILNPTMALLALVPAVRTPWPPPALCSSIRNSAPVRLPKRPCVSPLTSVSTRMTASASKN